VYRQAVYTVFLHFSCDLFLHRSYETVLFWKEQGFEGRSAFAEGLFLCRIHPGLVQ
jgi:hypothetical protein